MTAAAQTKEQDKTYRDKAGQNKKSRKQGTKVSKQEIVLKAFIVTNLPVSATKPSREPCHTIGHLLPALHQVYTHILYGQLNVNSHDRAQGELLYCLYVRINIPRNQKLRAA